MQNNLWHLYNKDESILTELCITDVKKIMKGKHKKYFYYKVKGTILHILKEAPEQEW
jgi:tRNA(Phe) wybutosine-synthesizing methylase Tyw3